MKKVLALVLAVLMLGSVTAFADSCPVFSLNDPVVTVNMGGDPMTIDLSGTSLVFGLVDGEETPTIAMNLNGGGETLLAAIVKVVGDQAIWTMTGLSNTYAVPTFNPANAAQSMQEFDLSGFDFEAIGQSFMAAVEIEPQEDGSINFKVPYTAFNEVLEAVLPLLDQLPENIEVDPQQIADFVADLKENQKGVTVTGNAKLGENSVDAVVNFIPVANGQEAAGPAVVLNVAGEVGESSFHGVFGVSVASSETGALSKVLSVELNVEMGETGVHGTLSIAADVADSGELSEVLSAEFSYTDKLNIDALVMGMYRVYLTVDPAASSVVMGFSAGEMGGELSFTYSVSENGEVVVIPLDEANAIDLNEMTEEQEQLFESEITAIGGTLMGYFQNILAGVAA